MTLSTVALIGVALMLALILLKTPIGFAMGVVGFLGIWYLKGLEIGVKIVGLTAYSTVFNYTLSCVALFLLMGVFAFESGISTDLYDTAQKWFGRLPGGLAVATVVGCGGFAAICGHSGATAVSMGTVAYPEMRKHGYPVTLAGGCIAAGGTMGSMIPPSIMMVVIAFLTEQSAGKLLVGGILPGILQMVSYAFLIIFLATFRRGWVPPTTSSPWKERLVSLKNVWPVLTIFLTVIGGIYAGIMTPTEAASVGAFATFVLAIIRRGLSWRSLKQILVETTTMGAMILMIIVGAIIFNTFLAMTRLPMDLARTLESLTLPPYAILGIVILMYLILGCIMDMMGMVVLTLPIVFPIIEAQGFDPIWFCVFVLRLAEIAMITPPVGINVYFLHGVVPEAPMADLFKGIIPFVAMDLINVGILIAFPAVITFLPGLMIKYR